MQILIFVPAALALITGITAFPLVPRACASGLNIIVARGSTEAQGPGLTGQVANGVLSKVPGSIITSVVYPASLTDYLSSEVAGVAAMRKLIQEYGDACPESNIVLMGYSQGAAITGDVMCGAAGLGVPATAALDDKYASKVVAIIQFGDPTHIQGLPGNLGTSKGRGIMPRTNAATCGPILVGRTQSYCDTGDTFCDSGANILAHFGYFSKYTTDVVDFVVSKASA